jgi:hypothetical protein
MAFITRSLVGESNGGIEDFGCEDELLKLQPVQFSIQLKFSVEVAPVGSSPGNGER